MNVNAKPSEEVSVLATIDPASVAAGTATSDWVDASQFHRFLALLKTGALGTSATVDAKLQQATDSSGTGAKDIAGKAITQLVKASNDNDQVTIDLRPEEMDAINGFTYFALVVTVGTAASIADATILGIDPRQGLATDFNLASVVENV